MLPRLASTPLWLLQGVRQGRKDMERFPATEGVAGVTSFCTGGNWASIFFLFDCKCVRPASGLFSAVGKAKEQGDGILLASASGLDMRSRDCRMRRAVRLVTPYG